jgi:hypothetical protein
VIAAAERLARLIATVPPRLVDYSDAEASAAPAPGRWSKKEILGHLIDSAANNHQRFVRTRFVPRLEIDGYEQERWVAAQNYAGEPWPDLVNLWLLFNRHLVHVLRNTPEDVLEHECSIGGKAPMTLAALAEDYVRHMEQHLEQIFAQ